MYRKTLVPMVAAVVAAHVFVRDACAADPVAASPAERPTKNLVVPGEVFTVAGRTAFLFTPAEVAAQKPAARPWILYGPT